MNEQTHNTGRSGFFRQYLIRPGLGRSLVLWFLLLSLAPLLVVGARSFMSARNELRENMFRSLAALGTLNADYINNYFNERLTDLNYQARESSNVRLMSNLLAAFHASGKGAADFVRSYQWEVIVHEQAADLKNFVAHYDYWDVLLLDADGNVLYSVLREANLGSNLLATQATPLSIAFRQTMENGHPAFSDFHRYAPSDNQVAGFLLSVLVDESGEKLGAIALQLPLDQVDRIMTQHVGLFTTREAYLIGTDLRMRSNSHLSAKPTVLEQIVDTEQTRLWRDARGAAGSPSEHQHEPARRYLGYRGTMVLGTHETIEVGGVRLGVITEVEEAEALALADTLGRNTVQMLLFTALLVSLVALFISRRLVRPVRALKAEAERIGAGDLEQEITVPSRNEIGELATSFNHMRRNLLESDKKLRDKAAQIDQKNRVANAVNRVFRETLSAQSEEDVGKMVLRIAEELTGSQFGFIGLINASGLMDTIAISNPGWEACKVIVSDSRNFTKNMALRGIDRSTLKEGRPRIVNADAFATHPDRVGTPAGHPPITCFLGVPFKREDKTVGMIGLGNREGGYTAEEQAAIETLSVAFLEVLLRKRMEIQLQELATLKTGQSELAERMQGDPAVAELSRAIITYLSQRLEAQTGLIYLADTAGTGMLRLAAGFAHTPKAGERDVFKPGEGLVGQAALEGKELLLTDVPEEYFTIKSGLGETVPRTIYIRPIAHNGVVRAVLEFGALHDFPPAQRSLLDSVGDNIAIALDAARNRAELAESLAKAQQLAEELQAQQEELKVSNEELEEQTQRLRSSEEQLKGQQDELQVSNEELEEKNELLEQQKREVEQARIELAVKADELALASKYKSEFLANMSHELRTPLNSLLLLAQSLAENKDGNLTPDQIESALVIHGSGSDLLNLINEILDLSKIEAGRMDLQTGPVRIDDLSEGLRASFGHMARDKGLNFNIVVGDDVPAEIITDHKRLDQILRNLMSNALKFTEQGDITVTFARPRPGSDLTRSGQAASSSLAIAVKDTGIGIPADKHQIIFEAFRQADGTTSRAYGGTGLGLTISRELATLLGGEIQVESTPGQGSTFTLYIPLEAIAPQGRPPVLRQIQGSPATNATSQPESLVSRPFIEDDRDTLDPAAPPILVIEDDPRFAAILHDQCHAKGFTCLAAPTGETGLELAGKYLPSAVLLDLRLPGMDGWTVLAALKGDTRTRHIPVHVISVDENAGESLRRGAVGHAVKPLGQGQLEAVFRTLAEASSDAPKHVLVVEDEALVRHDIVELIGTGDVEIDEAETGEQAMQALRSNHYDCVVLDLRLPDMNGKEILTRLADEGVALPPVVVHTAVELSTEEEAELREHAESIVVKDARSTERLLDEVSLFLHRVVNRMPDKQRQIIQDIYDTDAPLRDKKVLVVDDDMRTTFAVSRLLAEHGMQPIKAENGERALHLLDENPDTAMVLMDIMMPVMDGYETMKRIRAQERFRKLPIIALTAKAMPEDREKCLIAGASDYLPKPLDTARLFSMMRVWIYS